jgi:hypothetical protein
MELFSVKNRYMMIFGACAISLCVSYIAYWRATADNQGQTYTALDDHDQLVTRKKQSKWL